MLEDLLGRASLTVETAASLLRFLAQSAWVRSVDAVVTIPAGDTSASLRHGLRRPISGAVVVGVTDATRTVSVDLPGSGSDRTITVRLSAAHASDFTVRLRVY